MADTANQRLRQRTRRTPDREREYATQTGKPSWTAFARELETAHYETLRRAVSGEREPSPRLLEECARVLGIPPDYLLEYRLYQARRQLDPAEVGAERAARNLATWNPALQHEKPSRR